MTDQQIEDLANRLIAAIEHLAPGEPGWWVPWTAFGSYAAVAAAIVAFIIGYKNLKHQQTALTASMSNDDRSEWWKRVQWALEAAMTVENTRLAKMGNELLRVLSTSEMASDADKDLLDSVWKAGTDAVTQESAVDAIAEATAFSHDDNLDDDSETSDNGETKEVDHG